MNQRLTYSASFALLSSQQLASARRRTKTWVHSRRLSLLPFSFSSRPSVSPLPLLSAAARHSLVGVNQSGASLPPLPRRTPASLLLSNPSFGGHLSSTLASSEASSSHRWHALFNFSSARCCDPCDESNLVACSRSPSGSCMQAETSRWKEGCARVDATCASDWRAQAGREKERQTKASEELSQ